MLGTNDCNKLITTHTNSRSNTVKRSFKYIGKCTQELVSHRMPEMVVHVLEPVDIDTHDGVIVIVAVQDLKNMLALGAIVNPCERIPISNLPKDFLLGLIHQLFVHVDKISDQQEQNEQKSPDRQTSRFQERFVQP